MSDDSATRAPASMRGVYAGFNWNFGQQIRGPGPRADDTAGEAPR